jgi:YidC/Oxa1 family membrane protein insertase
MRNIRNRNFRYFSTTPTIVNPSNSDVVISIAADNTDALTSIANVEILQAVEPTGYTGIVMQQIENLHLFLGIPYWESILLTTVILRVLLVPLAVRSIQHGSRLGVIRPQLQKMQEQLTKNKNLDVDAQNRYQAEVKALFKYHQCNPFYSIAMPVVQLPIFITFFFALQSMGNSFPGLATGGAFWFENLTLPDVYLLLPIVNSVSFLLMIELGADGVKVPQQGAFKWIMRGLGVAMVPLTMHFPTVF